MCVTPFAVAWEVFLVLTSFSWIPLEIYPLNILILNIQWMLRRCGGNPRYKVAEFQQKIRAMELFELPLPIRDCIFNLRSMYVGHVSHNLFIVKQYQAYITTKRQHAPVQLWVKAEQVIYTLMTTRSSHHHFMPQ